MKQYQKAIIDQHMNIIIDGLRLNSYLAYRSDIRFWDIIPAPKYKKPPKRFWALSVHDACINADMKIRFEENRIIDLKR